MAHDSLRKSVFELVNDLGLDVVAFGGEFHSIEEEDETDQPERSVRVRAHSAKVALSPPIFLAAFVQTRHHRHYIFGGSPESLPFHPTAISVACEPSEFNHLIEMLTFLEGITKRFTTPHSL